MDKSAPYIEEGVTIKKFDREGFLKDVTSAAKKPLHPTPADAIADRSAPQVESKFTPVPLPLVAVLH